MKFLKNIRIMVLVLALILAIAAINPRPWQDGVTIRNVEKDSAAALAGIASANPETRPVLRERITAINSIPIEDEQDYVEYTKALPPNTSVRVETNKKTYVLTTKPHYNTTILPEVERVAVTREQFNNITNAFENVTENVTRNKTVSTIVGTEPLGITVYNAPKTNIRFGLDISGGARVLLEPEREVTQEELTIIIDTITERLNIYGVSDIVVRPVSDLSGKQFVLVEVAGASERDVRELVLRQGKFEAKIGDQLAYAGRDITYVCRSPDCAQVVQCQQFTEGYMCQFQFEVTMTPEAAERQASITRNLAVIPGPTGKSYLEKPIDLYLDDQLTDTLQIGAELKGSTVTTISISGSGTGATQRAAQEDALSSMKQLQTILVSGSLPVKMNVVKVDSISSELGDEFIKNALFVGMLAFLAVTIIMVVRYRNLKISVPVMITLISEVLIILGIAAALGWNMDLAGIAGILIAIGTGVDDQIVIADETIGEQKRRKDNINWKDQMKKAFFIIMAAYFTALAAMIPLWWAGAGLVRGFAITTIIGITAGVLITRPAFAVIMENLEKED
jgi:preprotein translocase subunit SecD